MSLIDPVDTRLHNGDYHDLDLSNVAHVSIAYGLDETAKFFEPMELSHLPNVTGMYFVGDHATLGGTDSSELGLSAIPARWLAEQDGIGYDPVAFNTLIAQPDPLLHVSNNNFVSESFPIALGGYEDREVQTGAEIHSSVEIRVEQVAGYNPAHLQNNSTYFASLDPNFMRTAITDTSGNFVRTMETDRMQFDTSNMLFTGVDTSNLDFEIDLQALRYPQPFLSTGEQGPWSSAALDNTNEQPRRSSEDIAPTRDNNTLVLG